MQLVGHFFHARRGHDLHAHRRFVDLNLDLFVVQLAFAQFLAKQLAGAGVFAAGRLVAKTTPRGRQQGIEDALFSGIFGAVAVFMHFLLAEHFQCGIGQIADDRLHIAANIAHFGELGRFHL